MRTSTEKGQNTRQKIIDTAFDLFHKQGINATSVDEVLEKSNTGKSQFYHYFKSKEGLVHEALQSFYEQVKSGKGPVNLKMKTWDDLERVFRSLIDGQKAGKWERGCPVGTVANELTADDELIRQDVCMILEHTKESFARLFHGLKMKEELIESADPDQLADFCMIILEGGLLLAKAQRNSDAFKNSVNHALAYLKSFRRYVVG